MATLLCLGFAAVSQGQVEQWRVQQLAQTQTAGRTAVAFDADGGSVIATHDTTPSNVLRVKRYSASGTQEWEWSTNFASNIEEYPRQVTMNAGVVFLATTRETRAGQSTAFDQGLIKLSPGGSFEWARHLATTEIGITAKPAADQQGSVYAAWQATQPTNKVILTRWNAGGVEQWQREYEGRSLMSELLLAEDGVVIAGKQIMKVRASGEAAWEHSESELGLVTNVFAAAVLTSRKEIIAGGSSYEGPRKVATLFKFAPDGAELWRKFYGEVPRVNLDQWFITGLALDEAENIFAAVGTTSHFRAGIPLVIKFLPHGHRDWISRIVGLDFTAPVLRGIGYRQGSLFVIGDGARGSRRTCPGTGEQTGGSDVFVARLSAVTGYVEWQEIMDVQDGADSALGSPNPLEGGVQYAVHSSGCAEESVSVLRLGADPKPGVPTIAQQPEDVLANQPFAFEAEATGQNLSYQWFSYSGDGRPTAIAGATGPTLNRPTNTPVDASFAARISNPQGTNWTRQAHIRVPQVLGVPQPFLEQYSTIVMLDLGIFYDLERSEDLVHWDFVSTHADFAGLAFVELPFNPAVKAEFFRFRERY